MRIVFLPTTGPDFDWLTEYYLSIFPEGGPGAYRRLERALTNLSDNPRLGKAIARTEYRTYSVPRTPFSLIYRIGDAAIEILHVWDQRSNPLDLDLNDGTAEP
ncbi:MAG TPA: type II toxin-antitoxin system RelE/ParE family toxin [Rhizobiaceae bacterium]|nr:type II toxin-antitoxin system RelE/ParE family toxin [Rhizobiaceae bacterium]